MKQFLIELIIGLLFLAGLWTLLLLMLWKLFYYLYKLKAKRNEVED